MQKLVVIAACALSLLSGGDAECSTCKQGIVCETNAECPAICYCVRAPNEAEGECQSKWGFR